MASWLVPRKPNASFSRRAMLIGAGQVAGFGLLAGRLYQLQVLEGQYYAPLADNNRISIKVLAPVRGRILDRNGIVLAGNEEQFALTVVPALTPDLSRTLKQLSEIIPLSRQRREDLLAMASANSANRPLVISENIPFHDVAAINVLIPQLPGVETQITFRRHYPAGAAMAHITGYTGPVTERAMDDEPLLRLPGIQIGKIGVELGAEERLRGTAGRRKLEVDARGRIIRNLETRDAVAGQDLRLTIDSELQKKVMARLAGERRAALVAMQIDDGALLSVASIPSFDNNVIARRMTKRQWRQLSESDDQPMFNRAIRGLYPPGSTFKMVTALAALDTGAVDLNTKVACDGSYTLADQTYQCWKRHGHGSVDLHRALRESCDCYFYELASRCGVSALASVAQRLGFGTVFDCGLPLQKKGVVPTPDWKRWRLNASWLDGETVLAGIGQGYVSTTPLQLAVMTARLASGRQVVPCLLSAKEPSLKRFQDLEFQPKHLQAVRRGMLAAVYEAGGTGHRVQIAGANFSIAGKTGTSQVQSKATRRKSGAAGWAQRDHALFVCFFPVDQPRYAVACVVEHGGSGGKTAAPLVREVIKDIVDYDRQVSATGHETAKPASGGEG